MPLGTGTSTMEENFRSMFGESAEEVAEREQRKEIKRKSEGDENGEWEELAKRLKEGSERRVEEMSIIGQV